MTLRSKTLLVTGLVCATLLAVAAILIWQVSLSSYSQLERQNIERDLERAQKALEANIQQLVVANRSYAYWNDTQAFVQGDYPDYASDNGLDNNVFLEVDIDLLLIADVNGLVKFDVSYNAEESQGKTLDEATLAALQPLLTRAVSDSSEVSGLISLPAGAAIFAALPILDNLGQGRAQGTLVMVRYVNEARLQTLNETMLLSLRSYQLNDRATLPETVKEVQRTLQDSSDAAISDTAISDTTLHGAAIRTSSDLITGYALLSDIAGKPCLIWTVEAQRTIYQQGLKNVLWLLSTLIIVGIFAVLAVGVLLERTILSRLSALSKSVRNISESGDVTARTEVTGKDELATLSNDINQMLASLEQQEEALRKSNQELEQFAYVASHDLQEPLRKVQAFSERLATKYANKLDDDGKLYIARMQDAAGRMRVLIQDLLVYSRVRSKGQEFVAVDLNEIVKGVVSDLEVRLEQSGGRVEVGSLPTIQADPMQMRQVFQNLIGNALKFKKAEVAPVVKVLAKQTASGHTLLVQDNGIGFEQQYAERIFEIFQRLHGRGDYEGTGMGLAIVKKILERHVGSIRAESEPGKGTRFTLTLPKLEADKATLKKTLVQDLQVKEARLQALPKELV